MRRPVRAVVGARWPHRLDPAHRLRDHAIRR
nr:MAG TPA: hypothetical protein [Caudoviricetes sp.]